MKSLAVAYLLWLLGGFGVLGLHRFYLGRWGSGLTWLLSLGLLGVGALIDLLLIPEMVRVENLAVHLLDESRARPTGGCSSAAPREAAYG
jgi:TM2 domain-containing membrane protein YozV